MKSFRLRRDGVACSDLGTEVVILDLDTSVYFSARDSAAVLVSSLVDGASVEALVEQLVSAYDVTPTVAEADVQEFLDQMRSRNLLEPVQPLA